MNSAVLGKEKEKTAPGRALIGLKQSAVGTVI